MERVLITGAAGFIGRHLIAALEATEVEIVALCRRAEDLADRARPNLRVAVGDLRDAPLCKRLLDGVDTLFHLAAVRNRPGSAVAEMGEINHYATLRLARQAATAGVRRVVHLATAPIYGPSLDAIDETAPVIAEGAQNEYVASKARAVLGLRELAKTGLPVVTLCPTIVYGPDHADHPNRVTSHVRRLLRRRFDVVIGDGEAPRDLVHVGDLVDALLAAARRPGVPGAEILVPGEPTTQRGLGRLVANCAGRPRPRVVGLPPGLARGAARGLDAILGYDARCGFVSAVDTLRQGWSFSGVKARALLDHRPRSLAQGIAETVAWIQEGQRDQ